MRMGEQTESHGVLERAFEIDVAGERVPGLLWTPADTSPNRPLILMGHGGSQHKRVDTLLARARQYVRHLGYHVAAIDAPSHGERVSPEEAARFAAQIRQRIAENRRTGAEPTADRLARVAQAIPEWQAALDAVQTVVGDGGPVGYWGVSMGTAIGVPFVAAEPRVRAAVFGLSGLQPGNHLMADAAVKITVPVEFALQSDDEIVSRESGFALFDAFASADKSLHLNPGGHLGIPDFERAGWERFFLRHLGA
jgi:dienelactone hydrolase